MSKKSYNLVKDVERMPVPHNRELPVKTISGSLRKAFINRGKACTTHTQSARIGHLTIIPNNSQHSGQVGLLFHHFELFMIFVEISFKKE